MSILADFFSADPSEVGTTRWWERKDGGTVVQAKGIMPDDVAQLGFVMPGCHDIELIELPNADEDSMLYQVPEALTRALANLNSDQMQRTAENWGYGSGDEAVELLRQLQSLARSAKSAGHHLFISIWV